MDRIRVSDGRQTWKGVRCAARMGGKHRSGAPLRRFQGKGIRLHGSSAARPVPGYTLPREKRWPFTHVPLSVRLGCHAFEISFLRGDHTYREAENLMTRLWRIVLGHDIRDPEPRPLVQVRDRF